MAINTVVGLYYYVAWAVRVFTPARVASADVPVTRETEIAVTGETGAGTGHGGAVTEAGAEKSSGDPVMREAGAGTGSGGAGTSAGTGGARGGWLPVGVAIALAGIVAVAFSVAPQLVLDLVPALFTASR
nr:hypothetical protein GCM10020093_083830 [Planobispora longispora]